MMKNLLKLVPLYMYIIAQPTCASSIEGKHNYIDISVSNIRLLDSDSYINRFKPNIKFLKSKNIVYTQHYNKSGYEMLTISSKPDAKFSATKLQVAKLNKKFLLKRNVMKNIAKFTTGKGIYLGMSSSEVSKILRPPFQKKTNNGIIIYHYELPNSGVKVMVEGKNVTSYHSKYTFQDDKLIEYIIGI